MHGDDLAFFDEDWGASAGAASGGKDGGIETHAEGFMEGRVKAESCRRISGWAFFRQLWNLTFIDSISKVSQ